MFFFYIFSITLLFGLTNGRLADVTSRSQQYRSWLILVFSDGNGKGYQMAIEEDSLVNTNNSLGVSHVSMPSGQAGNCTTYAADHTSTEISTSGV